MIPRTWPDNWPSLRVCWLWRRNAVRRWPLAVPSLALTLLAIGALVRFSPVGHGMEAVARHPIAVLLVTGLIFAMAIYRRRRRMGRNRHRDWLGSLPRDLPLTLRALSAPLMGWVCAAFALLTASITARFPFMAVAILVLAAAGGLLGGALGVGAIMALEGRRELRVKRAGASMKQVRPASQYAPVRSPRASWATGASLVPLGHWPMARARFSERPKMRARALLPLLLALPLDAPAAVALAAAAAWLLTMHLVSIMVGLMRVAFAAASWLAPTGVGAARFTLAVTHRALPSELATCALLVLVAAAAGPRAFHAALTSGIIWMIAACLLGAAVCLIAIHSHSVARSYVHRWMR
jgi:hypothetical protein